MTINWQWIYASVCLTLLLPQSPYLCPPWTRTLGRFLHSQQIGSTSLACLVPLQVSLPFGNSSLSICFSSVQSVQPDGNSFEIYLFKSQLPISPLMFLVRFSSCPCLFCCATASSLQAVLSPGLWLPGHSNLQRHFSHRVAVTGALIHSAANNSVCHPQWLCRGWITAGKNHRNVLKKVWRLQEVIVASILKQGWGISNEHCPQGKSWENLHFRSANSCNVQVDLKVSLVLQVWPNLANDCGSGSLLHQCLWNALVRGTVLNGAAGFVTSLLNWIHTEDSTQTLEGNHYCNVCSLSLQEENG